MAILKGFDVNTCQVGISLETNQLIFTRDFAEFLDTGQLKVTYPVTPYNTAIRLAKKYRDLGCYCDLDSEFNYLSQVPLVLSKYQEIKDGAQTPDHNLYAPCFGEKNREQYLANREILDKYFILEKYEKTFKTSELQSGNLYTLKPRATTIDAAYSDCRDVNQIQRVHELISGRRSIVEKNKKILSFNGIPKEFVMAVPKYADCDFHDKHLRRIDHFLSAHPTLAMTFFKMQLNVQEQIDAIKTLEHAAGQHGLFVYGLVEQKEKLPDGGISEKWLEVLVNKYKKSYPKAIKERENIAEFPKAGCVRELTSVEDLGNEGISMKHCVGGYGEFLLEGRGCLFHIDYEGEESTLQISKISSSRIDDYIDVKVIQHRGRANVSPIKSHEELASQLADYLSNKINNGKRRPTPEGVHALADYF